MTESGLDSARATFERAVTFLRSGDATMAERLSSAALEDYGDDPNFLTLQGAALCQLGRPGDAETPLRRAIAADPAYAKAHEQLGMALLAQDRPGEAIPALRLALELDPTLEPAQVGLSQALAAAGQETEGKRVFDAFLRQKPQRQLLATAAEHHRAGRLGEAESAYREILRQDPANAQALRLLGRVATAREHYRDAALLLAQAVHIAPAFHAAWLDLGQAQLEFLDVDGAVASYRRAVALEPNRVSGHIGLGNALARSKDPEAAVAAYLRAIEVMPENPAIYLGLGNNLKTIGRQKEAVTAYRNGLQLRPDFAEIYWSLSNLKTFRFADAEIAAMEREVEKADLPGDDAIFFHFALGKAAEDTGEFDRAFHHFERGNSLRRAREHYDPVQTESIGEEIRSAFNAGFFARKAGQGHPDCAPIFIVGLPRSGSTLIEQILASHSAVEATFELPEGPRLIRFIDRQRFGGNAYPASAASFPPGFLAELGRRYEQETARFRHGAPRFIDKMPNNFALVGLLHLALPNARFINARRDPLDTCVSCYKQLFARGQSFTYDLLELGEYYLEYERMMAHWHDVLPGRILDVRYEDVVADVETQARRLLDFCGLPWEDRCLRFYETRRAIRTASSEQVRRPIYGDAVGVWRNYRRHIQVLADTLAPILPA